MASVNDKADPEALKRIYADMLRMMITIRKAQEKIAEIYPQEPRKIQCPVHLYTGEEAIAAGVCANLAPDDLVFSYYRGHGHYLAKGGDIKALFAELYGKASGCSKGRGGSMHLVDAKVGFMGTSAIVGGAIPLAVGAALAFKMRKEPRVAVAFFGDGACEEGVWHESMNFAALQKLPVLFVCENNFYAVRSPIYQRQAQDNISARALNYGMPGLRVDGNDALSVYWYCNKALEGVRDRGGPVLLEARTYRWRQHVENTFFSKDILEGRPESEAEAWMARCPIKLFAGKLVDYKILEESEIKKMNRDADRQVAEAVQFAETSPFSPEEG